jgi:hypothetical protein
MCLANFASLDLGETGEAGLLFRDPIVIGHKKLGGEHLPTQCYQSLYARLLLMTNRARKLSRAARPPLPRTRA